MNELIGKTINNYKIEELVGEGAMGIVFRAYHPDLQQNVAIKLLRPELVNQSDSYERFLQEARTAAQLKHDNIVKVLNFGEFMHSYYLMMDFINGISLREFINQNPRGVDHKAAAQIFTQIAGVLSFAHEEGVLHRDLKPDNILLTMDHLEGSGYKAMVTDFGLVKIAHNSLTNTRDGTLIGTPAYMSPEQCSGGVLDGRSDIYSLGVMLYEAVTGKRPYPIRNLFDAVKFHSRGQMVDAQTHAPGLPKRFNILIRRMMNTQIDKRPKSADDIVTELGRFIPNAKAMGMASIRAATPIEKPAPVLKEPSGTAKLIDNPDTVRGLSTPVPFCIVVSYKGQVQRVYPPLIENETIIVGRQSGADIILSGPERYVSKEHCVIEVSQSEVTVKDLNSTNGTFLGNERLSPNKVYTWEESQDINLGVYKLSLKYISNKSLSDTLAETAAFDEPTMIQGRYILKCPGGSPAELPLLADPIIIGRLPTCDLVLTNARVSKRHCRIESKNGEALITDLQSTNGTYMGDTRLPPNQAVPWDETSTIRVGDFQILIEI
ncbi:MAG: FHA domain-containing serine/threonine-protein kinase [Chloroflexota bacterium]